MEAIRVLRVAGISARHDRTAALNQMCSLVSNAPDKLRDSSASSSSTGPPPFARDPR